MHNVDITDPAISSSLYSIRHQGSASPTPTHVSEHILMLRDLRLVVFAVVLENLASFLPLAL